MKKEERDILYNQKIAEGKSPEQAHEEVQRDIEFIKQTKEQIRNDKKEIKQLKIDKENVDKEFKKSFKLLTESRSTRKIKEIESNNIDENSTLATTKDLSRILSLLQSEGTLGLSDLTKTCCLNTKVSRNALSFLSKFEIVELIENGGTTNIKLK